MFFVAIQGSDLVHFVVCEGEAEEVEIFTNMVWIAGAGDDDDAALQIPAQDDLGRGCEKVWAMCSDLMDLLTQAPRAISAFGHWNRRSPRLCQSSGENIRCSARWQRSYLMN